MGQESRANITILDIAKAAGTSPATVSRVLNGSRHNVNPDVQRRIREVVDELGYTPNPLGRMLKKSDIRELAVILPSLQNPFYIEVLSGIECAARDQGYDVLIYNSHHSLKSETAHLRSVLGKRIRGLLIAHAGEAPCPIDAFLEGGGMAVALDQEPVEQENCINIDVDCFGATRAATEHLFSLGHRYIAYASLPLTRHPRHQQLRGFMAACRAHGVEVAPELLLVAEEQGLQRGDFYEYGCGRQLGRRFLDLSPRPTALVANNDVVALGCFAAFREAGVAVPGDVSIVGLDGILFSGMVSPELTTMAVPSFEIGRQACERLLARMACGVPFPPERLTFAASLRPGASAAAPSARADGAPAPS